LIVSSSALDISALLFLSFFFFSFLSFFSSLLVDTFNEISEARPKSFVFSKGSSKFSISISPLWVIFAVGFNA